MDKSDIQGIIELMDTAEDFTREEALCIMINTFDVLQKSLQQARK